VLDVLLRKSDVPLLVEKNLSAATVPFFLNELMMINMDNKISIPEARRGKKPAPGAAKLPKG